MMRELISFCFEGREKQFIAEENLIQHGLAIK